VSTDLTGLPVTDLQRRKLERRFEILDRDGDGKLEQEDYEGVTSRIASAFGHDPDSPRAAALRDSYLALWAALLKKMDTDGDGMVSREEFVTSVAHSIVAREDGFARHIGPIAHAVLDLADTNGNGELDADEFSRMWVAIGVPASDTAQAFQQLDRDQSGRLSLDEITTAIHEFYTSADPDAPGNALFGLL
jgi:Ca2+-binding EF-hand superfamily protein